MSSRQYFNLLYPCIPPGPVSTLKEIREKKLIMSVSMHYVLSVFHSRNPDLQIQLMYKKRKWAAEDRQGVFYNHEIYFVVIESTGVRLVVTVIVICLAAGLEHIDWLRAQTIIVNTYLPLVTYTVR